MEKKDTPSSQQSGHDHDSLASRKAQLLREGEFYRAGVMHAKAQVMHAARPDVMLHSAIDHATWALRSRADALLQPTGINVASLAPYALSLFGFIRRRRLGKPALGAGLVLSALGWYVQRKRAQQLGY
jgi:hypothetical protein